jgi:hypothetical protein
MRVTTKFSPGDRVYRIASARKEVRTPCAACEGRGRVTLADNADHICPACYGQRGHTSYEPQAWRVDPDDLGSLIVGQVRFELHGDDWHGYTNNEPEDRRQYMCWETGVGSGTLLSEDDLFASEAEARAECDRRNEDEQ